MMAVGSWLQSSADCWQPAAGASAWSEAGQGTSCSPAAASAHPTTRPHLLVPGEPPGEEALGVLRHVCRAAGLGDHRHAALHIPLEQDLC